MRRTDTSRIVHELAADGAIVIVEDQTRCVAMPTGLRALEPLKMTSSIDSPRRVFAELSPITHRTASMTFDFPQPFGPTTPVRLLGSWMTVGSDEGLGIRPA